MQDDLIRRDDAIRAIAEYEMFEAEVEGYGYASEEISDWDEIGRMRLANVPSVDAVTVVRCKDCSRKCICYHSADYYCADGKKVSE